ncbi:MAG: 5-(carboxyamino)imidazole ribonucleotide synthase [Planctomycetota bacterium]
MNAPILPGAELGVFGGGQLGRMFAQAAARLGYRVAVFAPQGDTPAGRIADREVAAPYDDLESVERFAREVDVVTFEFENIPSATVEAAAKHVPVRPAGSLLHTTQNRAREKAALVKNGLPVAPHMLLESIDDVAAAAETVGFPSVLKTAAWGYDGHGQRRVANVAELEAAYRELGAGEQVLEAWIPFDFEISVVGARGVDGKVRLYEPVLNRHENHILDVTICPAPLSNEVRESALEIARTVLEGFDVVGVLCVELFVLSNGELMVNELAPRPHNSGHITIDAHDTCQFEQQVRTICGLPLGSTERIVPAAAMANLLGNLWDGGEPNWAAALENPGTHLHLYGKTGPVPGRKMGHLTVTGELADEVEQRIRGARADLTN